LEDRYKTARGELRRALTDLLSDHAHITLFGFFLPNLERRAQMKQILYEYEMERVIGKDTRFMLEIKGLGSWATRSGNIVLYADLTSECRDKVKWLAKDIRDYVHSKTCRKGILATSSIPKQLSIEDHKQEKEDEEEEGEESDEEIFSRGRNRREKKWDVSSNREKRGKGQSAAKGRKGWKNERRGQRGQRQYSNLKHQEDEDEEDYEEVEEEEEENEEEEEEEANEEEEETNEKEEEDENEKEEEEPQVEDEEILEEEEDGMWMDDPKWEIYMPHLTIMNTDPKLDKSLWRLISEGKGGRKTIKREREKAKGRNKVKKGEDEPERRERGGGGGVGELPERDIFGRSYNLMRDVRKRFARVSFGVQRVEFAELQEGYECMQRVYLSGQPRTEENKNNMKKAPVKTT